MTRTKIYCDILSLTFLKNHRPIIGNPIKTMSAKIIIPAESFIQKAVFTSPVVIPTTIAKTSKASISVITVPPTVTLTARFLTTPNLLTNG